MGSVTELNKHQIRLFVEAVLSQGRLVLIEELIAADYLGCLPCAETAVTGPAGVRRFVADRRRAHPGLHIKIEDQVAEDDRVVTRWQATATTSGTPAASIPAGPAPCCAGISITWLLAGEQVDSRTQCGLWKRLRAGPWAARDGNPGKETS